MSARLFPPCKGGLGGRNAEANRVPFRVVLAEPTLVAWGDRAIHATSFGFRFRRAPRGARRARRRRLAVVRLPRGQPGGGPRARPGSRPGDPATVRLAAARDGHRRAAEALAAIAPEAIRWAGGEVARGAEVRETAVQRRVLDGFERAGLVTDNPPIVGFQANAANPHYEPRAGVDRRLE